MTKKNCFDIIKARMRKKKLRGGGSYCAPKAGQYFIGPGATATPRLSRYMA